MGLLANEPAAQVRYTRDGSSPKADSALGDQPLTVSQSATVNARVFRDGVAGPNSTGVFTVDPDINPLDGDAWRFHGSPGAGPRRRNWVVMAGMVAETPNHIPKVSRRGRPEHLPRRHPNSRGN